MVITADPDLAARTCLIRAHGAKTKYFHEVPGYNSRLDEVQAAILRYRLGYLDRWNGQRRALADNYTRLFDQSGLHKLVRPPLVASGNDHVFHQYTLRVSRREELSAHLKAVGIDTTVYYPVPLHLQPVFANLGGKPGDLPVAERLCQEALSLPMFPELRPEQRIGEFYSGKAVRNG